MPDPEPSYRQIPEGAVRRVIFSDEAWYADSARLGRERSVVEEWSVGVDARTADGHDDGTHGEGSITWHDLGGSVVWRLNAFHDGLRVLTEAGLVDLLCDHEDAERVTLRDALLAAGWADLTDRIGPYATRANAPPCPEHNPHPQRDGSLWCPNCPAANTPQGDLGERLTRGGMAAMEARQNAPSSSGDGDA